MSKPVKHNGQVVGKINSRNKYVTERTPETYVKKYKGFGISTKVMKKIKDEGINTIVIKYNTGNDTTLYKVTPKRMNNLGTVDQLGDYDQQVFLPKNHFTKVSGTKTTKQQSLSTITG